MRIDPPKPTVNLKKHNKHHYIFVTYVVEAFSISHVTFHFAVGRNKNNQHHGCFQHKSTYKSTFLYFHTPSSDL